MQGKNSLIGDLMAAVWKALRWLFYVPRYLVLPFIIFYQKTISPDHGLLKGLFPHGYCRFSPSCSQYGYLAIKKYGVIIGGVKTIWRIARCNPWSEGGIDLP